MDLNPGFRLCVCFFLIIENADATPPHLDVFVRLGSSVEMLCSLHFFALGLLSLSVMRSLLG